MTIKEMEQFTGMNRANIRFYEAEGLITPQRQENGYRVYSQADGETLMKIRLLRYLGLSLEDVKAVQTGALSMEEALRRSLEVQEKSQSQLHRAMELTRQMLSCGVSYETLDAAVYLRQLESEEILQQDREKSGGHAWRRYYARYLDWLMYTYLSRLLLGQLDLDSSTMMFFLPLIMMLLLEPLQLSLFGTTVGKWVLGLRVQDLEERRLGYSAGLERTWTVLWEGQALRIPLVQYYFLYKSYEACEAGEYLPWEWDSEVTLKKGTSWRWVLFILVYIALFVLAVLQEVRMEGVL